MIVSEMIEMLLKLDPDTPVMMESGESLISVCAESDIEEIPLITDEAIDEADGDYDSINFDKLETHSVLVLKCCSCETDILGDDSADHFPTIGGDIDSAERLN